MPQKNPLNLSQARVEHIAAFGPVVRVELSVAGASGQLTAEMPRSRLRELHLRVGEQTHVRVRTARIFSDGHQAAA